MIPLSPLDLSALPPPGIIETLDYQTIKSEMIADLTARLSAEGYAFTALLESDPAIKLIEVAAYREMILRQRVNDAARSNLLAFASGDDLEQLAAFYGVLRLENETDIAFRTRLQQRIQGWATAGGTAHYRYWALSASADVKDAAVSSPEPGRVRIAVLSTDGDGAPDQALLDAVSNTVLRDDVRVLTDAVEVAAARILPVDINAGIWLYPDAPEAVFETAAENFRTALNAARGLGWDLTLSWIMSKLHTDGVHKVVLNQPVSDVLVAPDECVTLGELTLSMEGRSR